MRTGDRRAKAAEGGGDGRTAEWTVYLLECADGTLYCGVTTDLPRRLAMHNGELAGGARYTRGRRPVALAASVGGLSRSEALRLEARVKKLPRAAKAAALEKEGAASS